MKRIIAIVMLFAELNLLAAPQIKFIEIAGYEEPQKGELRARFLLECYQSFLQVIDFDTLDPETNKRTLHIGGLVFESQPIICPNPATEIWVPTIYPFFNDQPYEIVPIKK